MDNRDARSFLSLHRADDAAEDARLAEAERQAATDPELARWWAQEQEVDRAIAAKLAAVEVPEELKTRLGRRRHHAGIPWRRAALAAAALIIGLLVFFGSSRGLFRPAPSLADFRDEMVSFVRLTPTLELETADLDRITSFLERSGAPAQLAMPDALRELEPIGCRVLRFRGHDVALICFRREAGRLAHLLVLETAAMRGLRENGPPQFAAEGDWMTAAWSADGQAYLLAVQGDQAAAERLLSDS